MTINNKLKKKVLLIAGNYFPEETGIGRYNTEMINWFADHGFDCTVLATFPYYPQWKVQKDYTKKQRWFYKETLTTKAGSQVMVYRCPHYIPHKPSTKRRMLLDLSYFMSVTLKLIGLVGKEFDFVMNVTPPLPLGILAALYKKICGAKFLYHVQDLQVDAARDLKMVSSSKLISVLLKIENYILKNADVISSISPGMIRGLKMKIDKPVHFFPNWSDTDSFTPIKEKASLKKMFGFDPEIPVVLYSGAIGKKQGLRQLLEAASVFQANKEKVQFVICGCGPYMETLKEKAFENKISNVAFIPLQPNEKLNMFLNMADVHLIMQKANAADLVMPSKLTNILSIGGLAVITANAGSSLYDLVSEYKTGILTEAENHEQLVAAIANALHNNHDDIKHNARNYAMNYLNVDKVMRRYVREAMQAPVYNFVPNVVYQV